MVEINLLSWRTQKNLYERKMLQLMMASGIAAGLIVVFIVHVLLSWQVRRDEQQFRQISAKLPVVRSMQTAPFDESPKEFLTAKSAAILLDLMANSTASGVCYQQFQRDENGWQVTGQALSVAAFTSAWRALAETIYFKNSVVNELKKDADHDAFQFVLHVPTDQSAHGE